MSTMCTHFVLTSVRNSKTKHTPMDLTTHTLPHTYTHTSTLYALKISVIGSKLCYLLFSCTSKLNPQKLTKIVQTKNWFWILFQYFHQQVVHSHSRQKCIIDYRFLTLHSLAFNPARAKLKFLPSHGIYFDVTLFIHTYFVKRVKPKLTVIHSWLHNTAHWRSDI